MALFLYIVFMQFHASSVVVVVCMLRIPEYAEISIIFYLRAIVIKSQLGTRAIS